jgi:16S rRNA (guanine1207-N2)-methyltransferase
MRASRITLAVESGLLSLPETGPVAVFRARADHDLSALPAARLRIFQGFRPDHDALARAGFEVAPAPGPGPYAAALVAATRAKAETLALIGQALRLTAPGGPVAVDGQKTDGIDSLLKDCRRALPVTGTLSKAHGKLFVMTRPTVPPPEAAAWEEAARPREVAGMITAPGLFSADGADPGSALLAAHLPAGLKGRVADLGAGWGFLSRAVLAHDGVTRLDLVEAEHAALDAARRNIDDPRAAFLWEDATRWRPGPVCDAVVTNPPFHRGRGADPELGRAFIRTAAAVLKPSGQLWLVANRQLPYERTLDASFRDLRLAAETPVFKLYHAARPVVAAGQARPGRGNRLGSRPAKKPGENG